MPLDRLAGHTDHRAAAASVKNLYPYMKRRWHRGLIGILLAAAGALFALPPPLITRYIVDEIIIGNRLGLLFGAILLLIGCLIIEKLAQVLEDFYFARLEQEVTLDVQGDLIDRILRLPKSFFDNNQSGYLQSRVTEDVEGLRWFFSGTLVHIISNTFRFIGGVVFLFYLEWKLSVAILLLLPGLFYCIRYFSSRIHILSHQSMEKNAEVCANFQESLSETSLIKAFASEKRTGRRLISSLKKFMQISLEQTTINSAANLLSSTLPGFARLIVLGVGAIWIVNDQWSLGSLLAFQAYLAYVFGPLQILASSNFQLQKALASLERVSAIFDIVPEENIGAGEKVKKLKGDVKFENVSFSYNGHAPVLKNLDFEIFAGEWAAILGPSGVGKTTIFNLMLRFYNPTSGQIFFDGLPASEYDVGFLRKRIGYVAQQPRLLTDTILENICYGNPNADIAQVQLAAKAAGIHDFIESLADGYATRIGENGFSLSEGQKQRISIARALVKNPDILILDEPTASLDNEKEKSIFRELSMLAESKTLFVATHRPSVIKEANRVLLLNECQVLDSDNHQALFTNSFQGNKVSPQPCQTITGTANKYLKVS